MNPVPPTESLPQGVTFFSEGERGDLSGESDSLPVKKQKLNEEAADEDKYEDMITTPTTDTIEDEYAGEEYAGEEFCPNYPKRVDKAIWDRYFQQMDESEGFDIEDFPGCCPMATIYPQLYFLEDPDNHKLLMGYAARALKIYNDSNGTEHEVVDVLKVNGGGCRYFIFYMTFSIKTRDGETELFQAKVVEDLDGSVEFPIIRPRKTRVLGTP